MKLGKTEPLRIFNDHHRRVRHVDTDLHHGGGDKNLYISLRKLFHDLVFLSRAHFAVERLHTDGRRQRLRQHTRVGSDIFHIESLALLNHRADDIGLTPESHLLLDEVPGRRTGVLLHHTVFDGQSRRRQLVHDADIQIPVQDHGEGSWNRRGAHDQHMGLHPLVHERIPLLHTETVLLVSHCQRQILKQHIFLNDGMSSDDNIHLSALAELFALSFLRRLLRTNQKTDAHTAGLQHLPEGFIML